jgi:hypothetical protein
MLTGVFQYPSGVSPFSATNLTFRPALSICPPHPPALLQLLGEIAPLTRAAYSLFSDI